MASATEDARIAQVAASLAELKSDMTNRRILWAGIAIGVLLLLLVGWIVSSPAGASEAFCEAPVVIVKQPTDPSLRPLRISGDPKFICPQTICSLPPPGVPFSATPLDQVMTTPAPSSDVAASVQGETWYLGWVELSQLELPSVISANLHTGVYQWSPSPDGTAKQLHGPPMTIGVTPQTYFALLGQSGAIPASAINMNYAWSAIFGRAITEDIEPLFRNLKTPEKVISALKTADGVVQITIPDVTRITIPTGDWDNPARSCYEWQHHKSRGRKHPAYNKVIPGIQIDFDGSDGQYLPPN